MTILPPVTIPRLCVSAKNLLDIPGIKNLYWHYSERRIGTGPGTSPQGTDRRAMLPPDPHIIIMNIGRHPL